MPTESDSIAKHLDAEGCKWRAKTGGMEDAAFHALLEIVQDEGLHGGDRVAAAATLLAHLRGGC